MQSNTRYSVTPPGFPPATSVKTWRERPSSWTRLRRACGQVVAASFLLLFGSLVGNFFIHAATGTYTFPVEQLRDAIGTDSPAATPTSYETNGYLFVRKSRVQESPHFYATWEPGEADGNTIAASLIGAEAAYTQLVHWGYTVPMGTAQFGGKVPLIFSPRPVLDAQYVDGYAPQLAFDAREQRWRSGILVNSALQDADAVMRVIAHEVFHTTQFTYSSTTDWSRTWANTSGNWFLESSADWFSYMVYPGQRPAGLQALAEASRGRSLLPTETPTPAHNARIGGENYLAWVLLAAYQENVVGNEKRVLEECVRGLRCAGVTPVGMLERLTGDGGLESIFVRGISRFPLGAVAPRRPGGVAAPYSWEYYRANSRVVNPVLLACRVRSGVVDACSHKQQPRVGEDLLIINSTATPQPIVR